MLPTLDLRRAQSEKIELAGIFCPSVRGLYQEHVGGHGAEDGADVAAPVEITQWREVAPLLLRHHI
jgi:hypothetical protein